MLYALYVLQIFDFLPGKLAVVTRPQMAQTYISDRYALQFLNRIPNSRKHLANLAILAFVNGNLHDGRMLIAFYHIDSGPGSHKTAYVHALSQSGRLLI